MRYLGMVLAVFVGMTFASVASAATVEGLERCNIADGVAGLPDESVLVLGHTYPCDITPPANPQMFVAKLQPDGALDTSFADGGIAMLPRSIRLGAGLQADGSGRAVVFQNYQLVRLTANGSFDPTFGDGGIVEFSFQTQPSERFDDISINSSNQILLVGTSKTNEAPVVARLLDNGQPDPAFGTGGETAVNLNSLLPGLTGTGQKVLTRSDGSVLVLGGSGVDAFVVKLDANGALDPSWASGAGFFKVPGEVGEAPAYARSLTQQGSLFRLAFTNQNVISTTPNAFAANFDLAGNAVGLRAPAANGFSLVDFPDERYLAAVGNADSGSIEPRYLQFAASPELLPAGLSELMTAKVGSDESYSSEVSLGQTGPGFGVGTASADPCVYLRPSVFVDKPYNTQDCAKSIVVRKFGGSVPFGQNGMTAFPAIVCEHGQEPNSITTYQRCKPPTKKIKAKVKGKVRFTSPRSRRPGIKANLTIKPQPVTIQLRIPGLLPGQEKRLTSRLKVTQNSEPTGTVYVRKSYIYIGLNPDAKAKPLRISIAKGGINPIPRKAKTRRFKFVFKILGRQINYEMQKKVLRARPLPRR
ncbi:MAG: hypothetical protein WBW62_03815 [Solirubrobacterales bacterium]